MFRFASLLIFVGACTAQGMTLDKQAPNYAAVEAHVDHPPVADVLGDWAPRPGPIRVVMFEDGIVIDVGGNIEPIGIDFAPGVVYSGELVDITDNGLVTYDDWTGLFTVTVGDFEFEMTIQYQTATPADDDVLLDNSDCPTGKKCCECTSNQGGGANAVCDSDERPLCTCSPCCSSTCIKSRLNIDGEF